MPRRAPTPKPALAVHAAVAATTPWTCTHFGDTSEIEAYDEATDSWQTIADVRATAGLDAEDIAAFIVMAANGYGGNQALLRDLGIVVRSFLAGKPLSEDLRSLAAKALQSLDAASS